MNTTDEDPLLRSSRREAVIALAIFAVALAYTIGYCSLHGYGSPAGGGPELVWGVPSWVFWGVFVPWGVCTVFHCWFSTFVMEDHELEEPAVPPDAGRRDGRGLKRSWKDERRGH